MRPIRVLLIAILFPFLVAPTANAAESSGSFSVVLPGDIGFGAGGVDGEFLVFSAWSSTPAIPYGINTIIEHNSALWWATSTPAASDEPGVASLWEKITDQTGGGGGFAFTQGNADPSGGSAGDWYLQHDGSGETEAIWFNIAGTWTEYEIPTAGTSTDDQNAGEVPTSTANFDGNLSASDNDVQAALDTIDDLSVGGGGTDDQTAAEVPVTTTNFDGNLSGTDDDVQAALETLDDLSVSGGTGDITAVGTAANSGLAGGADSGDVDLIMDVANLVGQTNVAGGDHLPFDDTSAALTKRITVQNYAAHLFPTSGGLAPTTSGQGHVRLHGLPGLTTFEGSDELGLTDDSTSDNVTKKATLVHVVEHVAGADFDVSTEAVMSLADGVSGAAMPGPVNRHKRASLRTQRGWRLRVGDAFRRWRRWNVGGCRRCPVHYQHAVDSGRCSASGRKRL